MRMNLLITVRVPIMINGTKHHAEATFRFFTDVEHFAATIESVRETFPEIIRIATDAT